MFKHGSLSDAYSVYLSEKFGYFLCEEILFRVMVIYIREACKGKPLAERRERLTTKALMHGMPNSKANRKAIRTKLKVGLKPTQALLDQYVRTFLLGRPCSFTWKQLLEFIGDDKHKY